VSASKDDAGEFQKARHQRQVARLQRHLGLLDGTKKEKPAFADADLPLQQGQ